MAANSIKTSNNAINPFQKFSTQLALELVTRDVKVLKWLTMKKVPDGVLEGINDKEEYCGLKWLACLTKHAVIWEYNVEFLIEALEIANRCDLAEKARKYQDQIGQEREQARTRSILVCNPGATADILYTDCDPHLFFAAEIGHPAGRGTNICKRMINSSKKALHTFGNESLTLVKFGSHGNRSTNNLHDLRGDESDVAVFVKDMEGLKAFCGGRGGTSGIADALGKFVDYIQTNELKKEILKLCILICFISSESSNLEYFRCPDGKDAIKLCNTLAEYAIPLYVIGIDHDARGMPHETEENHFLSGITLIGGGQYFQVSDVKNVEHAIQCIIQKNTSIEANMGTANDIVILERNNQGGDLNVEQLAEHLQEQLNIRSCTVDSINNESSKPISQLVQRIAWADDLDDAINAVKSLKEQMGLHKQDEFTTRSNIFSTSAGGHYRSFSPMSQNFEGFSPCSNEMPTQNPLHFVEQIFSSTSRGISFDNAPSTSKSASFSYSHNVSVQNLQTLNIESSSKPNVLGKKRKAKCSTRTQAKRRKDSKSISSLNVMTIAEGQRVGMDDARRILRRQITRQAYYKKV